MREPNVAALSEGFGLLENRRRRRVVSYLTDESATASVETLAERIAETEHGAADAPVDDEHVRDVHVGLHHVHLPKLADAGVVAYDTETGAVELADTSVLDAVFRRLELDESDWEPESAD